MTTTEHQKKKPIEGNALKIFIIYFMNSYIVLLISKAFTEWLKKYAKMLPKWSKSIKIQPLKKIVKTKLL